MRACWNRGNLDNSLFGKYLVAVWVRMIHTYFSSISFSFRARKIIYILQ